MIYVTGDTHGEQARFYQRELLPGGKLKAGDHLIVCGDFGYLFKNDKAEGFFLDDLEKLPYTLLFIDGNHENFPAIYEYPEALWNGGRIHKIRKNIFHLMRGEIFEIEGKTFFTMGGAYSRDKYMRTQGVSWWAEEKPTDSEYKNAASNLEKHNFNVDYIITHTLPREVILRLGYTPDEHDMELTGFLEWVMHEVSFKHWYCGHWHIDAAISDKITALWYDIKKID